MVIAQLMRARVCVSLTLMRVYVCVCVHACMCVYVCVFVCVKGVYMFTNRSTFMNAVQWQTFSF